MPRTANEIRDELNALYAKDETMRQGTAEYQELRSKIKKLITELAGATPLTPAPMTVEHYHRHSPDSFRQAAINRKAARRERC